METVCFDTETHLIRPGLLAPPLVCMTYTINDGPPEIVLRDQAVELFRGWINDPNVRLVGHHVPFDLAVMCVSQWHSHKRRDHALLESVFRALDADRICDTELNHRLSDVTKGRLGFRVVDGNWKQMKYSLATLAEELLGVKLDKSEDTWRTRYAELDGVPLHMWPEAAVRYALMDAQTTRDVWFCQERSPHQNRHLLARATRTAFALHLTTMRGLRTDGHAVDALETSLLHELEVANAKLVEKSLVTLAGKTNQKYIRSLCDAAFRAMGKEPPRTEKGLIQINKEALMDSGDPLLKTLASISNAKTLRNNFLKTLRQGVTGPICPEYTSVLETMRTSSWKPNIQNQPKRGGVRECFVPRDGYYFTSCDYSTLELRTLAQVLLDYFGESRMADALKDGKDLHLLFAADLLEISYDEAVRRLAAGDPAVKAARQEAKAANFGFPGGLGVNTFMKFSKAQGRIFTHERASVLKHQWLKTFPEMNILFQMAGAQCDPRGVYTDTRTGFVRGDVSYTAWLNTHFQHRAAVLATEAHYNVTKECYVGNTALSGSHPVAFIHDEILAEVPKESAHEAAFRIAEIMMEAQTKHTPNIPSEVEPCLMDRWYKDASAVYDGSNRLVPYVPNGHGRERDSIVDSDPELICAASEVIGELEV